MYIYIYITKNNSKLIMYTLLLCKDDELPCILTNNTSLNCVIEEDLSFHLKKLIKDHMNAVDTTCVCVNKSQISFVVIF